MKFYESYTDENNNKKIMKCIRDYLNGNETQQFYCEKHDVNYHAFKRHWAKFKESHKEQIREIIAKKECSGGAKDNIKDNKVNKYLGNSETKIFKKQKEEQNMNFGINIGGDKNKAEYKFERTPSNVKVADPKSFFGIDGIFGDKKN